MKTLTGLTLCGVLMLSGCAALTDSIAKHSPYLSNPALPSVKEDFPGNRYEYGRFKGA